MESMKSTTWLWVIAASFIVVGYLWLEYRKIPKKVPQPRKPSPCGDNDEHYWWVSDNWPCPICAAKHDRIAKRKEEDRQADLIASKVVSKLRRAK